MANSVGFEIVPQYQFNHFSHIFQHSFPTRRSSDLWTDFGLVCIFEKVFESTLRVYQWEAGIAIHSGGILEMVLKDVRKIVNHCLKPDFESEQVHHFWTDFGLVCIFGKVFESTLRVYRWEVGIAIFGCGIGDMVLKDVRKMVKSLFKARFWIWRSSPFLNRFWFSLHI